MLLPDLTYDEVSLCKTYAEDCMSFCGCIEKVSFPYEDQMVLKLLEEWSNGTSIALSEALEILTGTYAISEDAAREVLAILDSRLGAGFATAVVGDIEDLISKSYSLGKSDILTPKQIAFNLHIADQSAIAWLQEFDMFWIGNYYKRNVSDLIAGIVEDGLQLGLGRADVGKELKDFFDAYPGLSAKPDVYWRGVAANGMNRSRNFGMVQGWQDVGVQYLKFHAVMDERTSAVCREMNGRIFPVSVAADQRDRLLAVSNPEDVKQIMPWPKVEEIQGLTTEQINAKNIAMPPLHFHCRSTVVEAK